MNKRFILIEFEKFKIRERIRSVDANVINELKSGLSAAYINGSVAANLAYKPAFVSNNPEEGKKGYFICGGRIVAL